jgi:tRNA(Ile)-lysidine synthase
MSELPATIDARWPVDATHQVALYRGRLQLATIPAPAPSGAGGVIDLSRPGVHPLPQWGGALRVARAATGVPASALKACTLRARAGGEQFQRAPRSTPRSLKKQYQEAGVPTWQRDGPLVYVDDRLLFVPGLGIDARWLADGRPARGLTLRWQPEDDPG